MGVGWGGVLLTLLVLANILDAVDLWAALVVGGFASLLMSLRFRFDSLENVEKNMSKLWDQKSHVNTVRNSSQTPKTKVPNNRCL